MHMGKSPCVRASTTTPFAAPLPGRAHSPSPRLGGPAIEGCSLGGSCGDTCCFLAIVRARRECGDMDVPASLRTQILSDLTLTTSTHHRSVTATQLTTTTTRATRNTTNLCITNLVTRQSTLCNPARSHDVRNAQPDQPVQHQPCIQMSIPHVRCPPDHVFVRASSEAGTRLRSLTKKDQQQHIRAIHGNMSNIRMIQKRIPDDRSLDYIQTNIAQQTQELGFELWIATVDFQSAFEPVEHRSVQEAWEETKSSVIQTYY